MTKPPSVEQAVRQESPAPDKRLERFVHRYIDSPLKLEIVRTVAHHPSRFYSLSELAAFTDARPAEVEQGVFGLEHLGLVSTKRKQDGILTGLSRSPAVREMAVKLFRYTSNAGGHARLAKIARVRR